MVVGATSFSGTDASVGASDAFCVPLILAGSSWKRTDSRLSPEAVHLSTASFGGLLLHDPSVGQIDEFGEYRNGGSIYQTCRAGQTPSARGASQATGVFVERRNGDRNWRLWSPL